MNETTEIKNMTTFLALKKYLSLDQIFSYLKENIIRITIVILIIIFYTKIRKALLYLIKKLLKRALAAHIGLRTFVISIIKFTIDIVLIFVILKLLKIDLTGIYAVFSIIGLVLGFAFKESLSNIFGGLVILTFKPFKVNDVIEYNGVSGVVKKIEIYYTTMINFQNENIIIPNSLVVSNVVKNINVNLTRRLDIQVGVDYNADIEKVKSLLLDIVNRRVDDLFNLDEHQPLIGMFNISDSSLIFDVRVYIKEGQYLFAKYYLNETIITEFAKNKINIPYNIVENRITSFVKEVKNES